jgi:hypothetical protein
MIEHIVVPELDELVGKPRTRFWSIKDMAILEKYYKLGVSPKEIAKYLQKTEDSITSKARRMGLIKYKS